MPQGAEVGFIPQEMREASLGSFPLSPGTMEGHDLIAGLYWFYRRDVLRKKTVHEVFGEGDPAPPKLVIPEGHRIIGNIDGLNTTVWKRFLSASFTERPSVNQTLNVRSLIAVNASSDRLHFERRLSGQRSKVIPGGPAPSLLRAFVFENKFPYQENEFYTWLILEMAKHITEAHKGNFARSWSSGLQALSIMWNATFPDTQFVSEK